MLNIIIQYFNEYYKDVILTKGFALNRKITKKIRSIAKYFYTISGRVIHIHCPLSKFAKN